MQTNQDYPLLKSAPIREAVIDARFPDGVTIDFQTIKKIATQFAGDYPQQSERHAFEAKFDIGASDNQGNSISATPESLMLHADNGLDLVQIKRTGISAHRLSPYTKWDDLDRKFSKLMGVVCSESGINSFSRFGVRFINEIRFPKTEPLNEYLKIHTQFPSDLPSELGEFFLKWKMMFLEENSYANIHVILEPNQKSDTLLCILDIDAIRHFVKPQPASDYGTHTEALRNIKNRIFFSCITDKARTSYL